MTDTNEADELAQELLDEFNKELQKDNLEEKVTENEIKENQNLYEDELDILSVKKYMLESYKKLDEYFEKKIRRRHAIDSSSEIRQRAEIKYLDMPMRELVAEVSEAHGADERNIYSIKSNASSRLMSIKFDKILLRLADLLDMSSYRVSKPILYHNMEQMSEESAFHWISHLLTQGYKLRTKYEIGSSKSSGTDNLKETEESLENIEGVLTPQTITEKLILEIPVDISQMSTIECENPCRKVQIGNISRQEITLICGEGCQNKSNDGLENRCNFLCRWFCVKNDYLSLRVIRQTEKSKSELFDLSKFRTSIKEKKIENLDDESEFLLTNFFDWFFEIGYSELIFADKAILYEGDSERLYIRKLIKLPEFSTLNDSYIAYIQVGGAYAHNYLPMLRMLKMKTLIITDLDYDKEILSMDKVKAEDSKSTNATINHCYRLVYPNKEENYFPTIKELYDFQVKEENILCDGRVYLAFQDEDSTARTLEEAMLKKILGFI